MRTKFFLFDSEFDSERASGIISTSDSNQKLRNFIVHYTVGITATGGRPNPASF
jgi:hypothetical protein